MNPTSSLRVAGLDLPVHHFQTVVVGSGAAGLNCADALHRLGVTDIALITSRLGSGTSANSGSDKQTYYKMGVFGDVPDSPLDFARTLTDGGMCHGDIAYIEGLGSLPAFFNLARLGVGFPFNRFGAFVGYKTDHDPRQRATSAGPKTSMQMVERSLDQVRANGTPILDGYEVIRLLSLPGSGASETPDRIVGLLALDRSRIHESARGMTLILAHNIVLATGGPGDLYRTSVYPAGQVGSHGLALEVGCRANNLTESQFGLASTGFRWNLSGTYQQAIPCYFSAQPDGSDPRFFLNAYFPTMRSQATNIFLKGYQWPFHAQRLQHYGSSIVDIAVHNEMARGRRVFMDFTRNPVAEDGLEPFSLDNLEPEAREYLQRSGALQDTPYDRLAHMNPLAIDIYSEHGVDLREPLRVAVCAQHCNGGLTVDCWWRTNVPGLLAIGEVAGTHGVRPGGSALNSGQVGGWRAAQWIAHQHRAGRAPEFSEIEALTGQIEAEISEIRRNLEAPPDAPSVGDVRGEIQDRMSAHAGFIRSPQTAASALEEALDQQRNLARTGQKLGRPEQLIPAIENEHLCRTQVAFLTALKALLDAGGGSRGAYVVLDEAGQFAVETRRGREMPHRGENLAMRGEILEVEADGEGGFRTFITPVRPLPQDDSWYENTWRAWRDGEVFEDS